MDQPGAGWVVSGVDAGVGSTSPQPVQASEILKCAYTYRCVDRNPYMHACSPSNAAAAFNSVLSVWLPTMELLHSVSLSQRWCVRPLVELTPMLAVMPRAPLWHAFHSAFACQVSLAQPKKEHLTGFDPFRSFCLSYCSNTYLCQEQV